MANIAIFRINYKSDFILTLNSDAGWMTPFCIKFWTGAPSQAYFVGYDGTTYTHCAPVAGDPTKLAVQFDDHHLPIGDLKFQIAYHFTVDDFPTSIEDEVINQASVIIEVDDAPAQVMLDLNGETAPEIQFSLPAYANEAQRIANEEQRIAAEQQRISHEESRIAAETIRQQNEAQRIAQETARVNEFATLKAQSQAATRDANDAATLANQKAQLAADKAALAGAAATLANAKAQLAADKAALANDAAQLANEKAALAQQKAEYAQTQGGYAKDQGDYAKDQGDYAKAQGDISQSDHERAETDHGIAVDDHTQAGNNHTRAESDHGIAANDHTQAGNDHTRAESDHGIAADDHTQAGNDHTRAESDHGIAADDHTQAGNDHTRAESDHTRAESDHATVEVYVDSLGAFDISAYHATGGVLAKYADLTAALGTNGANIPDALRKGGMSVKFVLTSDNNSRPKYEQYRLMSTTWSTDTSLWAISEENVYIDDPEFLDVKTDRYGKLICAIEKNGNIKFGAGVPQQIIDYINERIAELGLDKVEDIVTFLGDLITSYESLAELLGEKVDKEENKSLIDEDVAEGLHYIESPEWITAETDINNKMFCGRGVNGEYYEKVGFHSPKVNTDSLKINQPGLSIFAQSLKNSGVSFSQNSIKLQSLGEIWNTTKAGDPTIYFPSIIETRHQNALGKYYMYYSYDHQYAQGENVGIKLAYSDDLINWMLYGNVLKARDQFGLEEEKETETPSVIYKDGYYIMIWHSSYRYDGANYNQNSYISRSLDGINWEYVKVAIRNPRNRYVGNLHDGYWHAFEDNGMFISSLLLGGTSYGYSDMAFSKDGYNWMLYPNNHSVKRTDNLGEQSLAGGVVPVLINGSYYCIGPYGKPASASAATIYNIGIQRVAEDRITPLGNVTRLYSMTHAGESTDVRGCSIQVLGGEYYLTITCRHPKSYNILLYKIIY